ncbi:histidine phosphatase family protein [Bacillus sp. UMB0893]|uniref:histidine phosphatase family protein n=1 Tax=Bacillus sp. UMB0893 TaxID=2066053 RepID=UPI000C76BC73|nr:histidine phosphatase family protein [Bacillus sp. UMB0893]PLR67106.1 histidine phosphatase family protein [Bacillus sp. UMB0893]
MQITLIRHLPTEWNVKTWLQGRQDIDILPITEDIQHKIETNQQHLKKLSPFEFVLASTLKRTHQTAQLYGMDAKTDVLLDELNFGRFEGRPKGNMISELGVSWLENPRELVLGERIVKLEERIINFLKKYKESNNILIFGHGSWIRAFISLVQYGHINQMNQISVHNNECNTLTFDENNIIERFS